MALQLVLPTPGHKQAIWDYREEFLQNNGIAHGSAGLTNAESFEIWFEAWQRNCNEETVAPGLVPATTFLGIEQETGQVVGMIDVRHKLNEALLYRGGHIGYSVRPSQRRKGYATQMLALALEECKKLGLDRALITCDKENVASARTILANGGVLENEVPEGGKIAQRYWVTLG